ncbi:MAG TPA: hypothetical protein VNA68_02820 [Candidatus Dormibacteraeota bacterium]|nr:hypothetical protein [Candidatus Dormibacteraeota bacterium]
MLITLATAGLSFLTGIAALCTGRLFGAVINENAGRLLSDKHEECRRRKILWNIAVACLMVAIGAGLSLSLWPVVISALILLTLLMFYGSIGALSVGRMP